MFVIKLRLLPSETRHDDTACPIILQPLTFSDLISGLAAHSH